MGLIDETVGKVINYIDRFDETYFVKTDSSLDRQIRELKELKKDMDSPQLAKDILFLECGKKGEEEISFELKNANVGLYVLRDVTITYEESTAQIDYVIISRGFTYLVECKNLIGNVSVDSTGQFRREYMLSGKKIKESMYSPYTQAVRHVEIFKKLWKSNQSKLALAFKEKDFDKYWYKPLVVLANSRSLLDLKYAPKEIKNHTVRVDQLVNYIKKDLSEFDESRKATKKMMEQEAETWLKRNENVGNDFSNKYSKITPTKNTKETEKGEPDETQLLEKLKQFRKERSEILKIPAYYIFSNEEMLKLANQKPDSMEKLSDILSSVKIKCHGKEILECLNNL